MKEKIIHLWRRFNAWMHGSFVSDCPRCHRYFYGFKPYGMQFKIGHINYRILCMRCVEAHEISLGIKNGKI